MINVFRRDGVSDGADDTQMFLLKGLRKNEFILPYYLSTEVWHSHQI